MKNWKFFLKKNLDRSSYSVSHGMTIVLLTFVLPFEVQESLSFVSPLTVPLWFFNWRRVPERMLDIWHHSVKLWLPRLLCSVCWGYSAICLICLCIPFTRAGGGLASWPAQIYGGDRWGVWMTPCWSLYIITYNCMCFVCVCVRDVYFYKCIPARMWWCRCTAFPLLSRRVSGWH